MHRATEHGEWTCLHLEHTATGVDIAGATW